MAKKAKLGRLPKKHKNTRRKNLNESTVAMHKLNRVTQLQDECNKLEEKVEVRRAHETSSIFIDGNRVYVRNLCDVNLINEHARLLNKIIELRRQLDTFDNLQYQMVKEKDFRSL